MKMFKTLLVEDSASYRELMKEVLQTQFPSMVIEEARDGKEALQKVGIFHPDLIFMDIKLPGENGLVLTQKIKKDHPEVHVIILTSYNIPEYREAARQCGADDFIVKGTSTEEEIMALVKSISPDLDRRTNGGRRP